MRSNNGYSNKSDFRLLFEQQRLIHYENLLLRKIEKIEERNESRLDNNKILLYISLLIPIMGYTGDVIGMKMIRYIPNYKSIIFNTVLALPSIILLCSTFKFMKLKKRIKIYNMKCEAGQNIVFSKYIIKRIKENKDLFKRINGSINNSSDFNRKLIEYYFELNNKDKIVFYDTDLKNFIYEYLRELDENICGDIYSYLCEVIISRHIIDGSLRKGNNEHELVFTINRSNSSFIQIYSTEK